MAKDPDERSPSMAAFVAELEECLRELGAPEGERTMILRDAPPAARRRRRERRRRRWPLALLGVLLLAAALAGGLAYALRHNGGSANSSTTQPPSSAQPVQLSAVASYDPSPGDGQEHDERLQYATDHDPSTYWETEHYSSNTFGGLKSGVGLVVAAPQAVKLSQLTIKSDTPGWNAVIKAGSSAQGPFAPVSDTQSVGASTTFTLHVPEAQRYYLIWITQLVDQLDRADVNEVTATG
jgi:hypothetical protein